MDAALEAFLELHDLAAITGLISYDILGTPSLWNYSAEGVGA